MSGSEGDRVGGGPQVPAPEEGLPPQLDGATGGNTREGDQNETIQNPWDSSIRLLDKMNKKGAGRRCSETSRAELQQEPGRKTLQREEENPSFTFTIFIPSP